MGLNVIYEVVLCDIIPLNMFKCVVLASCDHPSCKPPEIETDPGTVIFVRYVYTVIHIVHEVSEHFKDGILLSVRERDVHESLTTVSWI